MRAVNSSKSCGKLLGLNWWDVEVWIFFLLISLFPGIFDSLGSTECTSLSHHLLPLSLLPGLGKSLKLLFSSLDLIELRAISSSNLFIDLWLEGKFCLISLVPILFAIFVSLLVLL